MEFSANDAPAWTAVLAAAGVCPRCVLRFLNVRTFAHYQLTPDQLCAKFESAATAAGGAAPVWSSAACTACVGILQTTETHLPFVLREVKKHDYQIFDYCMCVTIPVSTPLRHAGLWHHIRLTLGAQSEVFQARLQRKSATATTATTPAPTSASTAGATAVPTAMAAPAPTAAPSKQPDEPSGAVQAGTEWSADGQTVELKEALKWMIGRELAQGLGVEFRANASFEVSMTYRMDENTDAERTLIAAACARHAKATGKPNKTLKPHSHRSHTATYSSAIVTEALPWITPKMLVDAGLCPPKPVSPLREDVSAIKSKKTLDREKKAARQDKLPLQVQRKRELELANKHTATATASGSTSTSGSATAGDDDADADADADDGDDDANGKAPDSPTQSAAKKSKPNPPSANDMDDDKSSAASATASAVSAVSMPHVALPSSVFLLNPSMALEVTVSHAPVFLGGNYVKLSRELPQSPWIMDGVRFKPSSVEEEIARHTVTQYFATSTHKFHASGREDLDVRMLGGGRPFILEIIEPHRNPSGSSTGGMGPDRDGSAARAIAAMSAAINTAADGQLEVLNLHYASREEFKVLKDTVNSKRKTYRCVVWTAKAMPSAEFLRSKLETVIPQPKPKPAAATATTASASAKGKGGQKTAETEEEGLLVLQQTPIRVLHRRTHLTRRKFIYSLRVVEWVNAHWFVLDLSTSAGTYVKEFVHGDRGRTQPNIGSILGCDTDIIQLDVTGLIT